MIEDMMFPDCPIRNILARLCDKWSLLVIYTLNKAGKEIMRFKELQRHYRRQEKSKEVKRLHVRFRHSALFGMQGHTTSSIL